MARVTVVKAGGDLARPGPLAEAAALVATLRSEGRPVVLVHGGGPQLDEALAVEGVATERVAGRRITSAAVLARAVRIWRGELSVRWVEALRAVGVPAAGLCGSDGGLLLAKRRGPVAIDGQTVDFGEVGDIESVQTSIVDALLAAGIVPVISPLAANVSGGVLNVNADTVASKLAVALGAHALVLATRAPGILADPDDASSTLGRATLSELNAMERAGTLHSGMRPKLAAVRHALEHGVGRVRVQGLRGLGTEVLR